MTEFPRKTSRFGSLGITASLGVAALAAAAQVNASCMDSILRPKAWTAGGLAPAVYTPSAAGIGSLVLISEDNEHKSIVGLWQFQFDGFSVDWGTQAWHSDGTEIIFSGGQNPETGDVCQGVWRKVGPSTYTLNHIAMGWLAPGAGFGLRVHFHAVVKVDATGDSYSGRYTAAVYSVSPQNPFDESVQLASGAGNMTATRVKPD
jgi:hypothetical protein